MDATVDLVADYANLVGGLTARVSEVLVDVVAAGMKGHWSPQPMVTTASACSASSHVSSFGWQQERSKPSPAIASITSG